MEISEHLRELRARLLVCLAFFVVASGTAFFFASNLWHLAAKPLSHTVPVTLTNLSPTEGISANLLLACLAGTLVSAPVILYHAYAFCAPAIPQKKRQAIPGFVAISTLLFLTGAAFAYFFSIPFLFRFLAEYSGTALQLWSQESYIAFLFRFEILFALIFQMPVLAVFFARTGIADQDFLSRHFRLVIFLSALFSAVITPPDIFSLLWIAVPILTLYGISLVAYRTSWRAK